MIKLNKIKNIKKKSRH